MIGSCEIKARRDASARYLGVLGGAVIAAAVAVLAGGPVTAAVAGVPASGGSWSRPRTLLGPRGLTGDGFFTTLSCASRSDCTAVGVLETSPSTSRFFAITERRGGWARAVAITAPIAGRVVHFGFQPVLSCASAGNCAAGDLYFTRTVQGAFVISETNGTWGKARKVPGTPNAISCPAPGDCTAALANGDLVNERRGSWRTAFPVPGLAALSNGEPASVGVISCPSPGNCSAAGSIDDPAGDRAFVITERHGIWGNAKQVRNRLGAGLAVIALSCSSAGNCATGGLAYPLAGGSDEAFAVTQAHGTWGPAEVLPGTAKMNGSISQLACPAAGDCTALGTFVVHSVSEPFVSAEENGVWHNPQTIAGAGPGPGTVDDTLACPAVGSCVLAGAILDGPQAATAIQVNGHWGPARVLPGILATDHHSHSAIEAVSCPAPSQCTAVGSFGILVSGRLFATAQG